MLGRSCKLSAALAAAALLTVTIAACGGGSSASGPAKRPDASTSASATATAPTSSGSGEVVIRVGSTPITKAQISHWMAIVAAGDYHELSGGQTIPAGLVSDPPAYGACVARLEAAAAAAPVKVSQASGVQLLGKCRQLYRALRTQAAMLLVEVQWFLGVAGDEGFRASDAEVLKYYDQAMALRHPNRAELSRSQAARRISTSDELLLIKKNLLSQKVLARVKSLGKAGMASLLRSEAAWAAKTYCRPGYVVEHCRQFHGEAPATAASPSPAVLLEQVATLVTGRCINLPACARQ